MPRQAAQYFSKKILQCSSLQRRLIVDIKASIFLLHHHLPISPSPYLLSSNLIPSFIILPSPFSLPSLFCSKSCFCLTSQPFFCQKFASLFVVCLFDTSHYLFSSLYHRIFLVLLILFARCLPAVILSPVCPLPLSILPWQEPDDPKLRHQSF